MLLSVQGYQLFNIILNSTLKMCLPRFNTPVDCIKQVLFTMKMKVGQNQVKISILWFMHKEHIHELYKLDDCILEITAAAHLRKLPS